MIWPEGNEVLIFKGQYASSMINMVYCKNHNSPLHCIGLNTCDVNKHLCLGRKCQVSFHCSAVPEHNSCFGEQMYVFTRNLILRELSYHILLQHPLFIHTPFIFIWVISGLKLHHSHYCWLIISSPHQVTCDTKLGILSSQTPRY